MATVKIHVHRRYKFDRIVIVSSKAVISILTNQWPEQVRKHQLTCTIHPQVLSVSELSCMNNKYLILRVSVRNDTVMKVRI